MLLEKITEKELQFMETWFTPKDSTEILFSDFDDFGKFEKDKFGHIRLYQEPMLSDESLIDFDLTAKHYKMNPKEKFRMRERVGDIINVGGRGFGKTLITLRLDIARSILHDKGFPVALFSIDEKRIRGVLDFIMAACHYHPIFRAWKVNCTYKPAIDFKSAKNSWHLQGVNLILKGKNPGDQWYQIHAKKIYGEEVSFENEKVYKKRLEAVHELGAVVRLAGMTDFTRHSPIGEEFSKLENKEKIINYPQFVKPYWDEIEKKKKVKDYGGENTIKYRIYVGGEIVDDGISEFDMDRVRQCYNTKEEIKFLEVPKNRFSHFERILVVDRPKNAERIFISADVGDNRTTILVHSEVGENYNYLYNIVLYGLINEEQFKIFNWLIEQLQANVVGIDCGDAFGRVLADKLENLYSKDNVVRYAGASKINVDFEKDEKGNVIFKNGQPVYRQEFMSEWSVRRLKVLLYNKRIKIPIDYQLDAQLNAVISMKSGTRVKYPCKLEDDHLFDAHKVFSISQWLKKDFSQTKPMKVEWATGACSWTRKKNKEHK